MKREMSYEFRVRRRTKKTPNPEPNYSELNRTGVSMDPINLFEKAEFSKDNFVPKQLHIGETSAAVLLCFEAGQTMPLHPHPGALEVILYGLEGEGTLAIGEEEKPFKKGDLIFCRGDVPIGPKNTGRDRLLVLVILVLRKLVSPSG